MIRDLSIILGNQLCKPANISYLTQYPIFMCESDDLCTHFNYHQLKIIFFLTAMRDYRDELITNNHDCFYHELPKQTKQLFFEVLGAFCRKHQVQTIHIIEIEDHFFKEQFETFCLELKIAFKTYQSPLFLTSHSEFKEYLDNTKKPFMKTFYEQQRKKHHILIENGKPVGGQWSFDEDNRKKTPKTIQFPSISNYAESCHLSNVKNLVKEKFKSHIGAEGQCWFPTKRSDVESWFNDFIETRFVQFGDYEDAIDYRSDFLFHSGLSMFINVGLITPQDIIEKVAPLNHSIPLNSLEGFIRQIIGWREFIRGIYNQFNDKQEKSNFFNHTNRLTSHWYDASTGIRPLDDAIKQVLKLGYTHHINRLMVIGNIMLLCRIDPKDVYKWFMECFIDSSDWVMGPNVYGMSQFSDGGIFATKPYFCGSNYIRKMSHYSKEPWCDAVDALYWRFIIDNQAFFSTNYRLKFMVSKAKSFSKDKLDHILGLSETTIQTISESR